MNAERFSSKEYSELDQVDFIRACELRLNERFLHEGIWRKVNVVDDSGIWFDDVSRDRTTRSKKGLKRFGVKNQQFVQIVKRKS